MSDTDMSAINAVIDEVRKYAETHSERAYGLTINTMHLHGIISLYRSIVFLLIVILFAYLDYLCLQKNNCIKTMGYDTDSSIDFHIAIFLLSIAVFVFAFAFIISIIDQTMIMEIFNPEAALVAKFLYK